MKRLLCMAVASAVVMGVAAQTQQTENGQSQEKNIRLGVKAGVGSGWITGLPGDKTGELAYNVGVTLDWYLSRSFSVNPELRFSHSATTVDGWYGSEQIDKAEFPLSLDYLELPVHAAFHVRLGGNCRMLIKVGPYLAYGLKGKTSVEMVNSDFKQDMTGNLFSHGWDYNGTAFDSNKHEYALPKFKRWDYGLSYAMGLEFGRIAVSCDMTLGCAFLTSSRINDHVADFPESLLTLSRKPRRMGFMLSAGYRF